MNQAHPLCQHIDRDTVRSVVHEFYRCLRTDNTLLAYFTHIDNWQEHESHIADFWWGVMGGTVENPRPNAMAAGHKNLHFGPGELDRWLALFYQTLQQSLPQDAAEQWSRLAHQLGQMMMKRGLAKG